MSGNRSKSAFFDGRWVTLSADFRGKGAWPTNHCRYQKTRVIAVSCGIKIFAVRCLVLSQYTHLMDGRTDRQNCDSNTVRCITCSRTVETVPVVFSKSAKYMKRGCACIHAFSVNSLICTRAEISSLVFFPRSYA